MSSTHPTTEPITTIARQVVPKDRRGDYNEWLRRFMGDAETLSGYLGTDVHPPGPDDDR